MEIQHPQSQFTPMARQDEPSHYPNQYSQPVESHYQDIQHTSVPTSGFQSYQAPVAPLSMPPIARQHEPASISSYAPDGHFSFAAKDGAPGGDINAAFPHHQGPSSSSVHQQEVPSSYSSVPGKEEGSEGRQHGHSLAAAGRAFEHAQSTYGNHALHPMDQPLEFAPRFSHENDLKMRSGYPDSSGPAKGIDTTGAMSSLHPWTAPAAPGGSYPPIAPAFPSAPQHDPSMGVPPFPGQPPAPMFERGTSFQPAIPPIGGPVGLGGGMALHSPAAFPVDSFGALSSERPKKAAVPNWLREEIIKNKATITSSVPEHLKEGTESIEDESLDQSTAKGDQADSKSVDSSKSTEEDDDEDYEDAQRIAAINQEIKRVLTEVLLKVTDELFDEIATKVLNEDDLTADVMPDPDNSVPIQKLSPPPPPVPAPKASAKVLVSVKAKESMSENASAESSSTSRGNVLGLANYASDEDDDENLTSSVRKAENDAPHSVGENGHPPPEARKHSRNLVSTADDHGNRSSVRADDDHSASTVKLNDHRMDGKNLDNSEVQEAYSRSGSLGKRGDNVSDDGKSLVKSDAKSAASIGKATVSEADTPAERRSSRKSSDYDSQERDARRHDKHGSKRDSSGKDMDHTTKEVENSNGKEDEKVESRGRRSERHQKKGKAQDCNIAKERSKEHGSKDREKTRDSESRKRSPHRDGKDSKKERERDRKTSGKNDTDRKRERTKDEKGDKSRHKSSSRHKRRRSSSDGDRSKRSKGSPVVSDGSSGETSEDSRRKTDSKRRNLSPSPVRSRQRQVSRSPHSKHSQRRHSPYPSLDGSRERRSRSRSRSPVRRHR